MLRSARLGVLMNRASVDCELRLACDRLDKAFPGQLAALFTPQHGLWGDAQANMVESGHGWYEPLKLPVYSLYSQSRRPTPAMLSGLDCLLIDLQDVGTRVYTFVWTMLECLRACAAARIALIVLDRPNPIGGRIVEGPLLEAAFRSFVGGAPIPMRHGLTIGELAVLLKNELQIDVLLHVVAMRGWSADLGFESLHRHWLYPSPNLPRIESTRVYPGQVLWEGTNVSEGRGTTTPFEIIGAPFVDPEKLLDRLSADDLQGIKLLPIWFRPTFDKWHGQLCGGVSLHVTDVDRYRPLRTSIAMLAAVGQLWPEQFRWLEPPYEYEAELPPIDIIYGSSSLRAGLSSGVPAEGLAKADVDGWVRRTADIVLYGSAASRFCAR